MNKIEILVDLFFIIGLRAIVLIFIYFCFQTSWMALDTSLLLTRTWYLEGIRSDTVQDCVETLKAFIRIPFKKRVKHPAYVALLTKIKVRCKYLPGDDFTSNSLWISPSSTCSICIIRKTILVGWNRLPRQAIFTANKSAVLPCRWNQLLLHYFLSSIFILNNPTLVVMLCRRLTLYADFGLLCENFWSDDVGRARQSITSHCFCREIRHQSYVIHNFNPTLWFSNDSDYYFIVEDLRGSEIIFTFYVSLDHDRVFASFRAVNYGPTHRSQSYMKLIWFVIIAQS